MSMAAGANAQLADGTVFPDFTRVDINGRTHHLYDELDSGKTAIIDISATWCGPCWSYHGTHALDSMWAKHGPAGEPGVNATTTNDMVVYWVNGEDASGMAQLTFNTIGSGAQNTTFNYTDYTRGNWVANTNYWFICDSSGQVPYNAAWQIGYFPTVYMICRDHLVKELTQPTEAEAYAAVLASCPTVPPSATTNAKTVAYTGTDAFVCNANPAVKFQNYGTNTITSASIVVKDGAGATVATVPWTGSLAPYDVANVTIPSFAGTTLGGYKYTVTVSGDSDAGDDVSIDSVFKVYSSANVGSMPFSDDLMTSPLTYKYSFPTDGSIALPNPAWSGCPNPAGVTTNRYLLVNFYSFAANTGIYDMIVGNFNTASPGGNVVFEFDQSYAQYSGYPSDELYVKVSNNCGSAWQPVWTGTGTSLSTHAAVSAQWIPTAASDWVHRTVTIPASSLGSHMMLKFDGKSSNGNFAWITNLKLSVQPVSVAEVASTSNILIAPNPASDMTNIILTLNSASKVQVQVIDAVGRVVNTISDELAAGEQTIQVPTANLSAGLYQLRISTGAEVTVKPLSVVK